MGNKSCRGGKKGEIYNYYYYYTKSHRDGWMRAIASMWRINIAERGKWVTSLAWGKKGGNAREDKSRAGKLKPNAFMWLWGLV